MRRIDTLGLFALAMGVACARNRSPSATAKQLGLYSQTPGLAGLLYRYERAIEWLEACRRGRAKAVCPSEADAEVTRALELHAAAVAADVAP